MAFGSGLSSQLMVAPETTVGTAVTPTIGYEILDETLSYNPTFLEGQGLKSGQAYPRASRSVTSRFEVQGDITYEHADRGHMGLQWKHAIGSAISAPTLITGTAYKQIHTPGIKTGLSQTMQVGRPMTNGTVQAFTYNGIKTSGYEFTCADNAIAQLKCTHDGWNESTATGLVAASYPSNAGNFTFRDCSAFTLGGTASTTAGETSVASGTSIASIVKGITITGTTPMDTERFGLGNSGQKAEQLENAFQTMMISLDCEFTNLTEFYARFKAGTYFPLYCAFSHYDLNGNDANGAAAGPNPYLLSFLFPAVKVKDATPNDSGPDIVQMKVDLEAYDDGSGTNPVFQVKLVSSDSTL